MVGRSQVLTAAITATRQKGKGWLYEGGIRVPLVIRWPGVIDQGIVSSEVVSSYDFMPTFCELLETRPAPGVDGVSFLSHIRTGEPLPERNHYWHYPHYHGQSGMLPGGAVRSGKYKLIEWYENSILNDGESAFELYDLENDIGEFVNLADSMKELTIKLAEDMEKWRYEINAQMPVPNPEY